MTPLDSSSNNQIIIYPIIPNLERLWKTSGRNDPPKLAEMAQSWNDPGWNDSVQKTTQKVLAYHNPGAFLAHGGGLVWHSKGHSPAH